MPCGSTPRTATVPEELIKPWRSPLGTTSSLVLAEPFPSDPTALRDGERLVCMGRGAATLMGMSRSFACEAVKRGEIPSMRIGQRTLVSRSSLKKVWTEGGEG